MPSPPGKGRKAIPRPRDKVLLDKGEAGQWQPTPPKGVRRENNTL